MKKQYEKPMLAVEHYSLTQAIAGCVNIKIQGNGSAADVLADPDATPTMKRYAQSFGFLSSGDCARIMDGFVESGTNGDTVCYHGPVVSAFIS